VGIATAIVGNDCDILDSRTDYTVDPVQQLHEAELGEAD